MNRYAQLSGGVVANVIESATQPDAQSGVWVACGNAGPGWVYDGAAFSVPVTPVPTRKEVINARLARIDVLTDKPRTRREMMLGNAATIAYATTLDNEAVALRAELAGLP